MRAENWRLLRFWIEDEMVQDSPFVTNFPNEFEDIKISSDFIRKYAYNLIPID